MRDPMVLAADDQRRAREASDALANICVLATVSADGQPCVRTLVLRGIDSRGFTVFLNANSPKWRELEHTERYELLLYWGTLHVQYRVRGTREEIEPADVADSWSNKPHGAKLLDWYYETERAQSSLVDSRERLSAAVERLRALHPTPDTVPCPPGARGLMLVADHIERLDLDDASRLHDRRLYTHGDAGWRERVMVP